MLTDTIISALTNVFAIFCSLGDVDRNEAEQRFGEYLSGHFGVSDTDEYVRLYQDLADFYADLPSIDHDRILTDIFTNLRKEIKRSECLLTYLRLLEFCSVTLNNFNPNNRIFKSAAESLDISPSERIPLVNFIAARECDEVKNIHVNGFEAPLKTMFLQDDNLLVFSYDGDDAAHVYYNGVQIKRATYQVMENSGVLKQDTTGSSVYYSLLRRAFFNDNASNASIHFAGRDIDFTFPHSTNGVHDFSFDLHSGELVAIMGGSGAGKTTLVSILNGTLKPQHGSLTINGCPITSDKVSDLIGFVPQDDLLINELTVYQNLYYTACMCLGNLTDAERKARVDKVLRELGLAQIRNLTVGSPIKKVISGGQRKRLNIALELIREPAVLFLDEPTSGLSSVDTENVIHLLKEQTLRGRLVVTNIHQPSSDVYKLFDRLWMLDAGGYPVFDGNPIDAITHFKRAANYADYNVSMCPTCGNVNPEVVLNIIEERAIDGTGQYSANRKVTPQQWHEKYLLGRKPLEEKIATTDIPPSDTCRPSLLKQWWIYLRRGVAAKATNKQYLLLTIITSPLLALICALLTRYSLPEEEYSLLGNNDFIIYIFMAVIVATFIGMIGTAEEIIRERALLKREAFLHLSYSSFIWAKVAQQAVITAVQTLLFVLVGNAVIGVGMEMLPVWWGVLYLTAMLASVTGLFLSQLFNTIVAVYISIPLLLVPQILLCGLVVDFSDLSWRTKDGNVLAIGNAVPSRWAYEALAVSNYTDNAYERDVFPYDKEKYEKMYVHQVFIGKLQEALETMEDARRRNADYADGKNTITLMRNELPYIAELCRIQPYRGAYDYQSLHDYLDEAALTIAPAYNKAALKADKILSQRKDDLREMKRNHCNTQLENRLAGLNPTTDNCAIVNNHLIPTAGWVYLTPRTNCGNAPFYSSEKRLGQLTFSTLTYNMMVMGLMTIVAILTIILNVPSKLTFLRKYFEHYKKFA